MNHINFLKKTESFLLEKKLDQNLVNLLETFIKESDDLSLFRINPYYFAKDHSLSENQSIDLFLYSAKAGIFFMEWLLLCPRCGDPVKNFNKLLHVQNQYHCEFCRRDYQTYIDDSIKISFTIHPDIRKISFHDPLNLTIEDYQYKYLFSREGKIPGLGNKFTVFFRNRERFLKFIEPGETIEADLVAEKGFLEGNDLFHHVDFLIQVKEDSKNDTNEIKAIFENDQLTVNQYEIKPGNYKFEIINKSNLKIPFSVYQLDEDFLTSKFNIEFDPYLTAKSLLNNKTFRDIFKGEDIVGASGLSIKDVTLLFTDLKGSTSLYERIGDLKAFSLVQQHFDEVAQVIVRNSGVLIKTIGDAIMASFLNPYDAMKASIEMLEAIENFNQRQHNKEIILKIGIHSGSSIAVTLNERIDYFGQIVNIAARVQGVAEGEEICFTREIFNFPNVDELVQNGKLEMEEHLLKGLSKEIPIYKFSMN
ncbi:MAG: DUF5939 domain-containing protein [Leptospira sp.]|nr:DUF5939 domain-containing protein [Leptospira sp.]